MEEIIRNKICVFHLGSCGVCGNLLRLIEGSGIPCDTIDANRFATLADKVEDFLEIKRYPIVLITGSSNYPKPTYLYIASTEEEKSSRPLKGAVVIGCTTAEEMLEYIRKA